MAVPANTTQTYAIRQREDLHKVIEMVTPYETPFFSSIGTGPTCDNTYVEWSQDSLRAADAENAVIEGDDVTPNDQAKPTVVGNYTQIFDEVISISDTAQNVKTIQTEKELTRQRVNAGKALRHDVEKRMCGNYPSVAGAAGTARKFASAQAWITTARDIGAGGTGGGWNSGTKIVSAYTPGTARPLTETIFKTVVRTSYDATEGSRSKVLVSATNKQKISAFTGIAQNTNEVKGNDKVTIVGTADIYVSDVGRHMVVLSRHMANTDILIYSPEKWRKRYLQPFGSKPLGTTGHNTKEMMKVELTLEAVNQSANAVIGAIS